MKRREFIRLISGAAQAKQFYQREYMRKLHAQQKDAKWVNTKSLSKDQLCARVAELERGNGPV